MRPLKDKANFFRKLQTRAELSVFEYENNASKESNNHAKRLTNWSSFKKAPYRNPKPVDNLKHHFSYIHSG